MEYRRPDETPSASDRRPRALRRGGAVLRGAALALGVLASGGAAAGEEAPRELLTLEQAVQLALAGNPGVRAAALAVERDGEAIAAARTRYLPALSGQAQAGKLLQPVELEFRKGALGTLPGVGPVPERDTTVRSGQDLTASVSSSLMQPITQLYTARQGVRLAEIGRDADRAALRAERSQLVADVKRLYHQLIAAEGSLAAAAEQLSTQRELARIASQQVIQQAALRSDEILARSAVAAAAAQVRKIENGLATGREQMNRLLGRDVRTPFRVASATEPIPEASDLEIARSRALQDRPELRQARLLVEKAETERRMKMWEHVPEVSVGVSYSSTFNVDTLPRHIAVAGAFAKWEWDWGRRGKEAAQRSLAAEEARAKVRDAEAAVLVQVGDRYRKLEEARDQVEATRLSLEGFRAKAPVVANRYRLQAALLKDALEVQSALAKAAHDHEEALLSLSSAQADFEQALGMAP
jgi:outer membrane protein